MATHSSVLAWRIPGTEEPGRLLSMGSRSQARLKRRGSSSREGNGTTCSTLVSEILGTEELGGLQSKSRAFLTGGNSPREAELLTKGPRALDSTPELWLRIPSCHAS